MMASKQDLGDEYWMAIALEEAVKASEEDEVPIGAVLVLDGKLIARDHNRTIQINDPTAHAEILALRSGAAEVGNYRLLDATLYVTVEPCAMCTGALIWSRVKRLVYGTCDDKAGCVESKARLLTPGRFNHNIEVTAGIISEQSRTLLREFFSAKRK
jgi:tRNA(adenine34) deaminase